MYHTYYLLGKKIDAPLLRSNTLPPPRLAPPCTPCCNQCPPPIHPERQFNNWHHRLNGFKKSLPGAAQLMVSSQSFLTLLVTSGDSCLRRLFVWFWLVFVRSSVQSFVHSRSLIDRSQQHRHTCLLSVCLSLSAFVCFCFALLCCSIHTYIMLPTSSLRALLAAALVGTAAAAALNRKTNSSAVQKVLIGGGPTGMVGAADFDGQSFKIVANHTIAGSSASWMLFKEPNLLYAVDENSNTTRLFNVGLPTLLYIQMRITRDLFSYLPSTSLYSLIPLPMT